ncbi:hypothetical protein JMM63_03985 [Rhodovulum sulfidophilum]|uniref:HIG1 domain-containing protein n=1 Tax=Rhodovulum sulfidophilum TaxID=35806 RepID=A0A0D6B4R6_RHOSU|nr:hypothetical protein [Rhodovulum sulfidophilum]ANB34020.1 hypothetical protein A6W98_08015 [Rhodovulum sulfidophilum DSM 1374]ANB37842.1 hypothetical protein A6024_07870 [Rhodovulum sulfidophilum]MBL3552178.1 hypothetical protein [Rhodovulum sulfidophilum]MBL3560598.1 hypothetical protein [Rhodovulum sulfidophilum]MBL3567379.1 hypothetical protein [Rhodovulum sulfidophilum]
MEALIWAGAAVSVLGLAGIFWCIRDMLGARNSGLPEPEIRARLQKAVAKNMAALALSAIGLMMVVVGIMLG